MAIKFKACSFYLGMLLLMPLMTPLAQSLPVTSSNDGVATICVVRRNTDEYVGKIIRLRAVYKTDTMYYAALFDSSCDSANSIDVEDPLRTHGDDSVRTFFQDERDRCRKLNQLVCPTVVKIDADVLIQRKSDGGLMAEFRHIRSSSP